MDGKKRWMGVVALATLLVASPTGAWADGHDDPCAHAAVVQTARTMDRLAREIVRRSLRPGARPEDWIEPYAQLVAETTFFLGLCDDPRAVARHCALCQLDGLPLDERTVPAVLLRWLTGQRNLFDPRVRDATVAPVDAPHTEPR